MKRFERPMLGFLSREEIMAIIGHPGGDWISQRDHLLMTMLYNTGARVSETIAIRVGDAVLDGASCVHLHGKGRKQRTVPLWQSTVKVVRAWLRRNPQLCSGSPLLPSRHGQPMTRTNVFRRFELKVRQASRGSPALAKRSFSPHSIRHTTAMYMLQSGIDITVIALWLGHENPATTHHYVEADLAMKTRALARLDEPYAALRHYRAPDTLMVFLKTL
jgi:site-specific recombinase XerD